MNKEDAIQTVASYYLPQFKMLSKAKPISRFRRALHLRTIRSTAARFWSDYEMMTTDQDEVAKYIDERLKFGLSLIAEPK